MLRRALFLPLAFLACVGATPPAADPNLWLEEIEGKRALDQVRLWNKGTADQLTADPKFEGYRKRAIDLLQGDDQIAMPMQVIGDRVLNLWRDAKNPRGLWRIAALDAYAAGRPDWRMLIDVDALGRREGKSWVWSGALCRQPVYDRCMVRLADGGTDAVELREFDLASGRFLPGGFALPTAESRVAWNGLDALWVATDFGRGTLTASGDPRFVKLWRRGTPLASATTVLEGRESDVAVTAFNLWDGTRGWPIVSRATSFFLRQDSHIADDGRLVRSPLPDDADIEDVLDGRVIAKLNSAWRGHPTGALIAYPIAPLLAGQAPPVERVFAPTARQAIEEVRAGHSLLWVKLLDDVSGKLVALRREADGRWRSTPMALPANATVHIAAAAGRRDIAFATVEGMLSPPALYAVEPGTAPRIVQSLPARFDATTMDVTQRFATSKDGTRVPYFLVRKKGGKGPVPALVHAYGGFRNAQTPTYLTEQPYRGGPAALFWVEQGNAYVLANIRGGGEYGPAWHAAALREKRQSAFDDFHAVAEDLVRTGVSAKGRIAPSGRSNGGLLVGVLMEQRPDLYGAIIMGSPLIDMQRYSHMLAGASWMGEYGDPDVPADWAFIARYSPYQNLRPGVRYPAPFIYTSTKDDRVHPGHARKFAARLEQLGQRFYYAEAIEGGHAAGADRLEDARRAAMIVTYLNRELAR